MKESNRIAVDLEELLATRFSLKRKKQGILQSKKPSGICYGIGLGSRAWSDNTVWILPSIYVSHDLVTALGKKIDLNLGVKKSAPSLSVKIGYLTPSLRSIEYEFSSESFDVTASKLIEDIEAYAVPFWEKCLDLSAAIDIAKCGPSGLYNQDRFLPLALAVSKDFNEALAVAKQFYAKLAPDRAPSREYAKFLVEVQKLGAELN